MKDKNYDKIEYPPSYWSDNFLKLQLKTFYKKYIDHNDVLLKSGARAIRDEAKKRGYYEFL